MKQTKITKTIATQSDIPWKYYLIRRTEGLNMQSAQEPQRDSIALLHSKKGFDEFTMYILLPEMYWLQQPLSLLLALKLSKCTIENPHFLKFEISG